MNGKSSYSGSFEVITGPWTEYPPGSCYRVFVRLIPEKPTGYSVYAPALPGAASQGETVKEALNAITEALRGLLLSYRDAGQPVPWVEIGPRAAGELERVVIVRL